MDPQFDGFIFQTYPAELARRLRHPFPAFRVLDARSAEEWGAGHVPGAILASGQDLAALLAAAGGRIELFVVGREPGDPRVRGLSRSLLQLGARRIVELTGGMFDWRRERLPTEGSPAARSAA
jgi:rhodanese-related sulfurtransferase